MKKLPLYLVIILSFSVVILSCESNCTQTLTYRAQVPIFTSLSDIRNSIAVGEEKPFGDVIKIVQMNDHVYLLDKNKGIHVLDYSDKSNPLKLGFIAMLSGLDITAHSNKLYVIQAGDLVVFDVSDPTNISVENRQTLGLNNSFAKSDSFVTGSKVGDVRIVVENASCANGPSFSEVQALGLEEGFLTVEPFSNIESKNDHLYVADNSVLTALSLIDPGNPKITSTNSIFGVQGVAHLTSSNQKLYVGAPSNIAMFDISNSPGTPSLLSTFWAAQSCGGFAVNDNVLLVPQFSDESREDQNGFCQSLEAVTVVDVRANSFPTRISANGIQQPKHMSIEGNRMTLAQGKLGFRHFDLTQALSNNFQALETAAIANVDADHTLVADGFVYVWGTEGISLYDATDQNNIKFLSRISQ